MKSRHLGKFHCLAAAFLLVALTSASHAQQATTPEQQKQPPTLDEILNRLQQNLDQYDARVPSFFCDEHVVSRMIPDLRDQQTVTDSVFRLKRVLHSDKSTTLEESREIMMIDGKPATSQKMDVPTLLTGAFEGGLAVVSFNQTSCMNYTLQRINRKRPTEPYVIRFANVLSPENTAGCLLQESSRGRAFIDPDTLQITRLELTTPHHLILPEGYLTSSVFGGRVLSVDYAPVQLGGKSFWMPTTITSRATSGAGTFHQTIWSFRATYRNYHKLEVTSRILPASVAPAK